MTNPSLEQKRASALLAAGGLSPDIAVGHRSIGYYDRHAASWSKPIIRVKMGRRVVTDDEQAESEFLMGAQWTDEQATAMRNRSLLREWYTDYLTPRCEALQ